jgi:hypothetical protein
MIIVSLKQHFPARLPEWWMSAMLIAWGAYVVLHPDMFTQPSLRQVYAAMVDMAGGFNAAGVWGLGALTVGMTRACALFVNGAYTRTPLIRLFMSFLSAFIWTQVCIGLYKSGVANTGIVVYGGFVMMDIVSAYRAATDMVFAEKVRHDLKSKRPHHVRNRFLA